MRKIVYGLIAASVALAPTIMLPSFDDPSYVDDSATCAVDSMNDTTGESHDPVYVCAPSVSPDGFHVSIVDSSDGWAYYAGSIYAYDPERGFIPA